VREGDFLAIIGRSGCGKTTLLRCLTGLIPQASEGEMSGSVEIFGMNTREHGLAKLATMANFVFQDPEVSFFCGTVGEEVAFGPRNLGLDPQEVDSRVDSALRSTSIQHLRTRRVVDLSGGEKQRLAIAAALSMRPRVMVLDEPTSDLDQEGTRAVLEVLELLRNQQAMTVVLSEHRLDRLAPFINRVVVVEEGRKLIEGRPEGVFKGQAELLQGLGIRVPLAYKTSTGYHHDSHVPGGRLKPPFRPSSNLPQGSLSMVDSQSILIRVNGLSFCYAPNQELLADLSFEISKGEIVALLGANGTGKTTLALLLAGFLKPTKGSMMFNGVKEETQTHRRRRRKVGLLYQNPNRQLFCDTALKEVEFGLRSLNREDFAGRADEMLRLLDLERHAGDHPYHLSEGERQRLATAATLAIQPDLLILDEPTTGQDWGHLRKLMDFLRIWVRRGSSVLLITHDTRLAAEYASRIMILSDGRIVADGPTQEFLAVQGFPDLLGVEQLAKLSMSYGDEVG
jgi:energy-coupling factor transport system ATP-binding protein